ncbi:MAG: mechanosensitive ion channel [Syntrophus sp. (in: bacteria)]|nr:mechanosensitive ion channel [Syntrophus sp. (in: bacteria)]
MLYAIRLGVIPAVFLAYLDFVLSLFPWTRGLANRLLDLITGSLTQMGKAFLDAIPNLLILVILYFFFRSVLRLLRLFFDALSKEQVTIDGFDPGLGALNLQDHPLRLIAFALIVAYPYIPGSRSAAFKGISIFLGVVFSLGSTYLVSNIIAGYMLTYRRAFKIGYRVKIGDVTGSERFLSEAACLLRCGHSSTSPAAGIYPETPSGIP